MPHSLPPRLAALALSLLVAASGPTGQPDSSRPAALRVIGLTEPVDVLRDRWGINHIYAKNEHDLFFAQGYAAARDRLFQLEMWRRQATGTVAELFGPSEVARDTGARLHLFRGDLRAELNWYHPRGEAIVKAFVAGINAYVDEARSRPNELPAEFALLGILPGHWTPAVVVSRHNGLFASLVPELSNALAIRAVGEARVRRLSRFQGGEPSLAIDPAIDLAHLTPEILDLYFAYRAPIRFTPERLATTPRVALLAPPSAATALRDALAHARPEDVGSNSWVVSGTLTASGKPMLMNDPHRSQAVPSLRYWVHLVAPGWNVIGGGEPVLPGVSIGHNEHAAWGLTLFGTDVEDLYVYETNPADPNQYRYRGAWEDMRILKETIAVKGAAPVTVELRYTRAGPVLREDKARRIAYALRAAWLDIGGAPYLASLRMNQAKTWEEFRDACRYSRTPAENMVWADTAGNIGYQAAAVTPIRRNWSGLVPVPGDGRYEWDGYLPPLELPNAYNPGKGFWVTANDYQFPAGYPHKAAQHHVAAEPFRAERITEVLRAGRPHTIAGMMRLQNDELSIPARAIVPLLRGITIADPAAASARDRLLAWDYVLDKDSAAAGVYAMFQRRLLASVRDLLVPKEAQDLLGGIGMGVVIDLLSAPDALLGTDPAARRDQLLAASLTEAVAELTRRFGADPQGWTYGKFHYARIAHPISAALEAGRRQTFDVGPLPRGGDNFTVTAAGNGDVQVNGASFKLIADLGDWDRSLGVNNPGQSGDPGSPHYRDLFDMWARGEYFPAFFSRAKIESVTGQRERWTPPAVSSSAGGR